MSCRQLFTYIFFVTRCHCTHKCVPGTPGNLGTDGLRTWEEVTSYLSTAVWLSLLSSGLASILICTSFWSRSRFIHFHSKCFAVDLRNNFFFCLLTLKIPLMRHQYIPAQARQAEDLAFELLQKGIPCSQHRWANQAEFKGHLPMSYCSVWSQGAKPKLQLELITAITVLRTQWRHPHQSPELRCTHKWAHSLHVQAAIDRDSSC